MNEQKECPWCGDFIQGHEIACVPCYEVVGEKLAREFAEQTQLQKIVAHLIKVEVFVLQDQVEDLEASVRSLKRKLDS